MCTRDHYQWQIELEATDHLTGLSCTTFCALTGSITSSQGALDAVVSALVSTIGNVATPEAVMLEALRFACDVISSDNTSTNLTFSPSQVAERHRTLMLQRIADADYAVFRAMHSAIVDAHGTWVRSKRQVCAQGLRLQVDVLVVLALVSPIV